MMLVKPIREHEYHILIMFYMVENITRNLTHKYFLFWRIIIFVTHMKTKNSPAVFSGTNLFELERIFKTRPLGGIIVDDESIKTSVLSGKVSAIYSSHSSRPSQLRYSKCASVKSKIRNNSIKTCVRIISS